MNSKAIGIIKEMPEPWCHLGNAYLKKGNFNKALLNISKAIKIKPDYKEAWYIFALIRQSMDSLEESLKACERALIIDPQFQNALKLKESLESNDPILD